MTDKRIILIDGTVLEQFMDYYESKGKTTGCVVEFIGMINARYIALAGLGQTNRGDEFPVADDKMQELIEFILYYYQNLSNDIHKAVEENWPQTPFIMRLASEWLDMKTEDTEEASGVH